MAVKKLKKDLWEEIFIYPSFNTRFLVIITIILIIILLVAYLTISKFKQIGNTSDQIAALNLIIQSATLVLGVVAAYYALRQLVETRFTGLEEAGHREIGTQHYSKAAEKWKEAFYIKPDPRIFMSMCESLLLLGDYEKFDQYIFVTKQKSFIKKEIFQEQSDQIILLYLRVVRNLLVKNQGEAEKYIKELIALIKKEGLPSLEWNFIDLQASTSYQNLKGECKDIIDNLIAYLSKNIQAQRKKDFENGNFSSKKNEPTGTTK